MLDTLTYRISGHSPSDASSYRSKEEVEAWMAEDSIQWFRRQLTEANIASENELDRMQQETTTLIREILALTVDDTISPRMHAELIGEMMFSNGSVDSFGTGKPEVLLPLEENPRVQQIAKKERFAFDAQGKPVSKAKVFQLRDAIFEAIIDRFYKDSSLIAYGEKTVTGAVHLLYIVG